MRRADLALPLQSADHRVGERTGATARLSRALPRGHGEPVTGVGGVCRNGGHGAAVLGCWSCLELSGQGATESFSLAGWRRVGLHAWLVGALPLGVVDPPPLIQPVL